MGRAIRGATFKAGGQAGPLGKGVPLTKAAGPGGLGEVAAGKVGTQTPQVPGFKGLMERRRAAAFNKMGKSRLLSQLRPSQEQFNTIWDKRMQQRVNRGGFFGRAWNKLQNKMTPQQPQQPMQPPGQPDPGGATMLPPPTGGLISKPTVQRQDYNKKNTGNAPGFFS